MRPLALRLQAFGSYGGEFAIDFARLGGHGVFSITGPTGAGKSTIFDAIVYALYDDLPGFRANSHVRSQFAEPGTRTEVTLEFEAEGRHWVLTRTPAQLRPKSRGGSGLVEDPSKVVLAQAGAPGATLTRKRDVAERLDELVGLTKAQFEQVVLIPQGRFEQVLKAKTQDRADLLAKLFPVDVYVRTTEALRRMAVERRRAYEELTCGRQYAEDRLRSEVSAFWADAGPAHGGHPSPDEELDLARLPEVRRCLEARLAGVTRARDAAAVAREEAGTRRAGVEAAVERWEQWTRDVAEATGHPAEEAADAEIAVHLDRAAAVATLATSLTAWRAADERLVALDAERVHLRRCVDAGWTDDLDPAALDSPTAALLLAGTVAAEAAALEEADRTFADLTGQEARLATEERCLGQRTAALAEAVTHAEAAAGRVAEAEATLAGLSDRAGRRPAVEARVVLLERDAEHERRRATGAGELADLTGRLERARCRTAHAEGHCTEVRRAWRAGLAGRLAAHLEDGRPCPTCGGGEHPDPARPAPDAPTDEQLEAAEECLRQCVERQRSLELRAAEAAARLDALPRVVDGADVEDRLAAARDELATLDAAASEASACRVRLDGLRRQATAEAAGIDAERSDLDARKGVLAERRTRWTADRDAFAKTHGSLASTASATTARRSLAGALTGLADNLGAAAAAASARTEHRTAMAPTMDAFGVTEPAALLRWSMGRDDVTCARAGLDARSQHRRDVAARIAAFVADGGGDEPPPLEPAREAERRAAEAHDLLVGRVATMTGRLAAVDAAAAELADGAAAVATARRAKEEADTLAGLCAGLGNGPDVSRLSLENWVLAYYLRQVLAHANCRLETMTNGRYALDLSEEHADGRRAWGLDISVRDAETGLTRPATTLSGGETFMAALALALGLADVVSSGSDYSIGALFVDEGFGSLDGDSLDTVVEVLRSLQDGGRMVGVISHVQELKDALPVGITVTPTTCGSAARVHYPEA